MDNEVLLNDLKDEIDGFYHYKHAMEKTSDRREKIFFCAMAKDERSHAEFIKQKIDRMGLVVPDDILSKFDAMKGFRL